MAGCDSCERGMSPGSSVYCENCTVNLQVKQRNMERSWVNQTTSLEKCLFQVWNKHKRVLRADAPVVGQKAHIVLCENGGVGYLIISAVRKDKKGWSIRYSNRKRWEKWTIRFLYE